MCQNSSFMRPTAYLIAPNVIVQVNDIFSRKLLSFFFCSYYIALFCEYLVIFFTIPTETVLNRPGICINTEILTLYIVIICLVLLPFGIVDLPTETSYKSNLITSLLHLISLVLNSVSAAYLFKQDKPLLLDTMNVTNYFRALSIVLIFLIFFSFSSSVGNTIIHGLAIFRIANRKSRLTEEPLKINSISKEIHDEISIKVLNSF